MEGCSYGLHIIVFRMPSVSPALLRNLNVEIKLCNCFWYACLLFALYIVKFQISKLK